MGEDGRPLVTRTSFRILQTLYNLGPGPGAEPDRAVVRPSCPTGFKDFCAQVSIDTSAIQYESDELIRAAVRRRRRDRLLRVGDAGRQADAVLRRPRQPGQDAALRDQRRPRRGHRRAGRAGQRRRSTGDVLDYDDVAAPFDTMHGLAGRDLRRRAQLHPLHARQVRLRAPRDGAARPAPCCAPWPAASPACRSSADSLSAIKYAHGARRCATRPAWSSTTSIEGEFPTYGNDDDRVDDIAVELVRDVHGEDPPAADLPRRGAHPVGADHHLERGVRQGHRQHPGRPPRRRAVRARAPTR